MIIVLFDWHCEYAVEAITDKEKWPLYVKPFLAPSKRQLQGNCGSSLIYSRTVVVLICLLWLRPLVFVRHNFSADFKLVSSNHATFSPFIRIYWFFYKKTKVIWKVIGLSVINKLVDHSLNVHFKHIECVLANVMRAVQTTYGDAITSRLGQSTTGT